MIGMKKTFVIVFGLLTIFLTLLPNTVSATTSSTIAFTLRHLDFPANETLYTMNQNGANQTKVMSATSFDRLAFSPQETRELAIGYTIKQDKHYLSVLNDARTVTRKVDLSSWTGQPCWYQGKIIYGVYFDGIYQYDPVTDQNHKIINSSVSTYDHSPSVVGENLYFVHSEWGTHSYVVSLPDWSQYIGKPILGPGWGYLDPSQPPPPPFLSVLPDGRTGDADTNMQYNDVTRVLVDSAEIIRYIVGDNEPQTLKIPPNSRRTTQVYLSNDGQRVVFGTNKGVYVTSLVGKIKYHKISNLVVVENVGSNAIAWSPTDNLIVVNGLDGIYLIGALSKPYKHRIYKLNPKDSDKINRIAWSH